MESVYKLSATLSSSKSITKEKVNVSDMDSLTGSMLSSYISKESSCSGFSDESAMRAVYGGTTIKDSKTKKTLTREERTEIRKKEIDLTFRAIRASECVDLLFILDCTGSMDLYIEQIKKDIVNLHENLKLKYSYLDMTFGFIRYTDFDQGNTKTSLLPLTKSTKEFVDFLELIKAEGGGDGPEDVFGGMDLIKTVPWRLNSTRVVIHIADAPCHGSEYHDFRDDHPDGDPNGILLDSLLEDISRLKLNYYFGHINLLNTGKMIDIFDKRIREISGNQTYISSFDSKDTSTINEKIFQSIEKSISTTKSKITAHYLKKGEADTIRKYTIVKEEPDYAKLTFVPMLQKIFMMPTDIIACLSSTYEMKLNTKTISIKMSEHPFSQGATRLAYFGIDENGRKIVLKQFKYLGSKHNSKKRYFESMECQTVAGKFSLEFNSLRKSDDIKFAVSKVLVVKDSEEPIYLSVESFIEGTYEKFNSNHGYTKSDDEFSEITQTFSHWTHHISKGNAIVVDIQGVKTNSKKDGKTCFLLTDPAIHTRDILKYGSTNLGLPGIIKFFETHKCNVHCHELGLKTPYFKPTMKK
ncbi:hypothetical protein DICPUDRAFT_34378 [Dictyostelium purpureum]|uniref:Alpha-type protein kinase domain-containing protein n=1 Tax=Dictyostelium purpureum TaxID=5786 RepID=F0ZMK4_DICPU|nr:uncharacterized protein DICPUDRAFT_34378 [Dictyostelium purpureum]EGC34842.1 hypothetical protein DICPUDRAFT_34378 [Dictyostelium purpureum]|eukprot:XP_003288649.1 hypothetical protein DICPUDRAFT_34378 [Dictyostelium purpureum]